ncbi:retrovirus-related pol polyprotein from transposon TNT 1-94 [Tanacetum coccineum]
MAVLTQRIDDLTKGKKDEGSTRIRAFIVIAEDEPSVGKADPRSGQWVDITMKKDYLKRYSKEPGPKVVFRDDSSGDTEGYGSVNCNGITFIKGTIFNQNYEVVLIAPRRKDVYIIDMSSFNKESNACFLANASPRVNWLWHKRLSHLNFKNINNLAKHNLVPGLPEVRLESVENCFDRDEFRTSGKQGRSNEWKTVTIERVENSDDRTSGKQ